MSLRDLVFNIFARDKTGRAFDTVDKKLTGIGGAVDRAQSKMRSFGRQSAKVGGAISAGMAPVALAFRDSLALYDTQARAQAKVEQAVKSTGGAAGHTAGELFGMAGALQKVTRYGDEAILDGVTAQLLTFDKISGDVFARAQEAALDMSTVLNTDLKSSSIMLGKALNDPVKGLNAMSRAGVSFTKDQEAVIKAMAEIGDIAGAQAAILDVLAKQYGGQARAAALAGLGPLDQLKNAWGDLKEDVGRVLAEMLPPLVGFFQMVVDGFLSLPEPVRDFATVIGIAAVAIGPLVAAAGVLVLALGAVSAPVLAVIAGAVALGAAIYALWDPIKAVAGFISNVIIATWEGLKAAFDLAMNSPLEFATKLGELLLSFNPVVLGVKAIGGVFDWLFPASMDSIKKLVAGAKEWLLDKLTGIFDSVKNRIAAVGDAFYKLWDRVVGHSYIPDLVDDIGTEMDRLDGEFVDPALRANEKVAGSFRDLADGAAGDLADLAKTGDLTIRSFYDTMLSAGERWRDQMLDEVFTKLADMASDKLGGIGGKGGSGGSGGFFDSLVNFGASLFGGGGSSDALTDALSGAGLSASVPGLDTGGEAAMVGGRGGVDRNLVRLRLSEGERVQVTRRGQAPAAANVTVNISTPNPAAFQASRVQIAGQISRAVAFGQRGM